VAQLAARALQQHAQARAAAASAPLAQARRLFASARAVASKARTRHRRANVAHLLRSRFRLDARLLCRALAHLLQHSQPRQPPPRVLLVSDSLRRSVWCACAPSSHRLPPLQARVRHRRKHQAQRHRDAHERRHRGGRGVSELLAPVHSTVAGGAHPQSVRAPQPCSVARAWPARRDGRGCCCSERLRTRCCGSHHRCGCARGASAEARAASCSARSRAAAGAPAAVRVVAQTASSRLCADARRAIAAAGCCREGRLLCVWRRRARALRRVRRRGAAERRARRADARRLAALVQGVPRLRPNGVLAVLGRREATRPARLHGLRTS
jgi:hypothetical protein